MTDAEDLTAPIDLLLDELQRDIGNIHTLIHRAERLAAELAAINTHQFELSSSSDILRVGIPDKFREVLQRYNLVRDKLSNYRGIL